MGKKKGTSGKAMKRKPPTLRALTLRARSLTKLLADVEEILEGIERSIGDLKADVAAKAKARK